MKPTHLKDKYGIGWIKDGDVYTRQGRVVNSWWSGPKKVFIKQIVRCQEQI